MTEDRKSVRRLLASADVYGDREPLADRRDWRAAVLAAIPEEGEARARRRPPAREAESAPLRPHHLLALAPLGAMLFGLGWWIGRGGVSAAELAAVPAGAWVAGAVAVAGVALGWRGAPSLRSAGVLPGRARAHGERR